MNIHICLVSDQLLANYIPVMMHKPDEVHLVSSSHVKKKGLTARFEKMLKGQDFEVVLHDDMPDTGVESIRGFAENLGKSIYAHSPNAEITLNITGGNKLMVLGMWEVFYDAVEIIYTDTFHNRLESLSGDEQEPLRSVLDIEQYLEAQGARYISAASDDDNWKRSVEQRKAVSKYLANNVGKLGDFFGAINRLANEALESENRQSVLKKPVQYFNNSPRGIWREALQKLHDAGLLKWDFDTEIVFQSAEKTRYLGGIWLEEYVYFTACDAKPDDVAGSVKINWESSRLTTNELDVMLVHNNRMLVIECKTLRFGRDEQKDSDMVYKVSDLGDELRGLFGKNWLVSAREPDNVLLERAKTRQLRIISAADLKGLRQEILKWMG